MGNESEIEELRRRLSLLEEGERDALFAEPFLVSGVDRHMLRKLDEMDDKLTIIVKSVDRIEQNVALLRADMPKIIAEVVGAVMREELARKKV